MSLKRIMFEYRKAKKDDLKEILDVSLKDPADYTEWICIQNYLMFNFKQLLKNYILNIRIIIGFIFLNFNIY